MLKTIAPILLITVAGAQVAHADDTTARDPQNIDVTSTAFSANEAIPLEYTCFGAMHSPPLEWGNVPVETKSIAILVEDPDAKNGTFTHWILANIPRTARSLPENAQSKLPDEAVAGRNDRGLTTYAAPCPPAGRHHYVFRVYALDTRLNAGDMNRQKFMVAKEGHVLGEGRLIGVVEKTERPMHMR